MKKHQHLRAGKPVERRTRSAKASLLAREKSSLYEALNEKYGYSFLRARDKPPLPPSRMTFTTPVSALIVNFGRPVRKGVWHFLLLKDDKEFWLSLFREEGNSFTAELRGEESLERLQQRLQTLVSRFTEAIGSNTEALKGE